MSKSLKRHNLPKLIQEEINNMNKPISVKEIEFVEESFLQRSLQGPDDFTREEELIMILHKVFQKFEEEGKCSNTFYEVNITLITNPEKPIVRKESYEAIYFMNIELKIL